MVSVCVFVVFVSFDNIVLNVCVCVACDSLCDVVCDALCVFLGVVKLCDVVCVVCLCVFVFARAPCV